MMRHDEQQAILHSRLGCWLLSVGVLLFPLGSLAAEPATEFLSSEQPQHSVEQPQHSVEQPTLLTNPFIYIDAPRDYLSGKFVNFTRSLDSFFGDDRNYQEGNNSLVQLDLVRLTGYGGDRNWVLSGRAKLDLPSTEKRFHLLIESNPDNNVTGEQQVQPAALKKVVGPVSYAAAMRYEKSKQQEKPWHLSTDMGVKFQGININPFARARGSYAVPISDWRLKAAETVFWFNTIGAGETTQLDAERFLSETILFRATSNVTWIKNKHNYDLRQDLSVYHTLDERSAVLYQVSAIAVTQPRMQATEYVMLLTYRYRLHKKWVFFEVSPQLHFPHVDHYRSNPALNMRLEMLFDRSN